MAFSQLPLHPLWKDKLQQELNSPYMDKLEAFITQEKAQGKTIFPKESEYFQALNDTPPNNVKIVILGQDPYHGENQAHGLCFSVSEQSPLPPSLKNIYKELKSDLDLSTPSTGNLRSWAKQGVLLLNDVLTVERSNAGSHQKQGWEKFTDRIIKTVNDQDTPTVFLLWGAHAQKKANFIDTDKHYVLKAPHPSPLSAYRGFLGCKHFSKANDFLKHNGSTPIDWSIQ